MNHGHRGYVVSPDLADELFERLDQQQVPYRVVLTPEGLGEKIRPVLVSAAPKPKGWTRYGRCKNCQGPLDLVQGMVAACGRCGREKALNPGAETIWDRLEFATPVQELDLPAWVDTLGVMSVGNVRARLADRSLKGVGPEREILVAEALARWRSRTLQKLVDG